MNSLLKRQQGLTLISLIFLLGIIGCVVLLALKIIPIYIDHGKVKSSMEALKEDSDIQSMGSREIKINLLKHFQINNVENLSMDDIKVIKNGHYVKVEIEYETIVPIVANLSVLAEFDDVVEAGQE